MAFSYFTMCNICKKPIYTTDDPTRDVCTCIQPDKVIIQINFTNGVIMPAQPQKTVVPSHFYDAFNDNDGDLEP